ncbi:hypothetical protein HYV86_00850 [Candidatus Woesearchaeota archaeon]|nr:hypothetical protein [Candidatus Woesearchaeota archaeon]
MTLETEVKIQYYIAVSRLGEIEQDVGWIAQQPCAHSQTNLLQINCFVLDSQKRYQVGELIAFPQGGGLHVGLREYVSDNGNLVLTKNEDHYPTFGYGDKFSRDSS